MTHKFAAPNPVIAGAEGKAFRCFKASTILSAWPSKTPHFLSEDALIRDNSGIEANRAHAHGIAYCWLPNGCENDTSLAFGFTREAAAPLENYKIGAASVVELSCPLLSGKRVPFARPCHYLYHRQCRRHYLCCCYCRGCCRCLATRAASVTTEGVAEEEATEELVANFGLAVVTVTILAFLLARALEIPPPQRRDAH